MDGAKSTSGAKSTNMRYCKDLFLSVSVHIVHGLVCGIDTVRYFSVIFFPKMSRERAVNVSLAIVYILQFSVSKNNSPT